MLLRRLKKSKYLRIVNLLGLSVIFLCLMLSFAYIKKELSYDRFHENADRIARLSIRFGDQDLDGRVFGITKNNPLINDNPGVEDVVLMQRVQTGLLEKDGRPEVVNNLFFTTLNFFEVFSFKLLQGEKSTVLDAPGKIVISKSFASQLFGDEDALGKEIKLTGRQLKSDNDGIYFISGIFEDFPENSHFHTDIIAHLPENDNWWAYVYLLLHPTADINVVKDAIALKMEEEYKDNLAGKASPYIMPLTDIHLHSRILRELDYNGNINYIYLIAGANLLLLLIVLFNLWLNTGLIFSFNRKYYQLLRLNGASSLVVVRDESLLAFVLGLASILLAVIVSFYIFPQTHLLSVLTVKEIVLLSVLFLFVVIGVSLLPVVAGLSATMFKSLQNEVQPSNFALSKVKYLLIAQYCIVMFIVIVSFGITKQINLIKTSQVGGGQDSILVMDEQPEIILQKYELLKTELLKYPEIKMVTSAMQLPGSAIRDGLHVRTEFEGEDEGRHISLLAVGNDFFPFFNIKPVAGAVFKETVRSYDEEMTMLFDYLDKKPASSAMEEYMINRKAAQLLGFSTPEEAVGKRLFLTHYTVGYINNGVIAGVSDDFNYSTTFEDSAPTIIIQRKMFQSCIMVHLSPDNKAQALQTFNRVWNEINPDYPASYSFLQDIYGRIYHNELNAEALTRIFSLLCLIIANLGLIIIMSFVIKRKTKEIGIRKVNGATAIDIIKMLNKRFVIWIGVAFVIAIPVSYYAMNLWLQSFAHKTTLDWWVFALSGLFVLLLSVVSITLQSWYAATINPVKSLKSE